MHEAVNREAVSKIKASRVSLTAVKPAKEVIPELAEGMVLTHSGPPLDPEREVPVVIQGGFIAGILFEGWAHSFEEAKALLESGSIRFVANQDLNAVAPGAGVITPNMSVALVRNDTFDKTVFVPTHEGTGEVMRFGGCSSFVLERLHWVDEVFNPALHAVLEREGPLELNSIMALALKMGDELHSRNIASTLLFQQAFFERISRSLADCKRFDEIMQFLLINNYQFFLNYGMGAAKAMLRAAEGIRGSTIVTAMGISNRFGIKVAGSDDWFTGELPELIQAGYLESFEKGDSATVLGDSTIMEALGLGIAGLAGAPGLWKRLGISSFREALVYKEKLEQVCLDLWEDFELLQASHGKMPLGIDCCRVVASGVTPYIGVAFGHRELGKGLVTGVGIFRTPLEPYRLACAKGGTMSCQF